MKPTNVKDNMYIDSGKKSNGEDPKFQVGGHFRTSKFKNTFAKCYTSNWSAEVFVIKKVKNTIPWIYVIGTFYEKELQKTDQKRLRIKKVSIRKGDELYVKWKG